MADSKLKDSDNLNNQDHFSLENQSHNVDSVKRDNHHNDADDLQRLGDGQEATLHLPNKETVGLEEADKFLKEAGIDFEAKMVENGDSLPRLVEIDRKLNSHAIGEENTMTEKEIIEFLEKSGAGLVGAHGDSNGPGLPTGHIDIEELKSFDHKQIDDYLSKTSLTDTERHKIRHQIFHLKHKGHEAMHTEMVLVMLTMLVIGQICLVQFKKRRPRSYNFATLLLLWLIPFVASIAYGWTRFICVWLVFSLITGLPVRKAVWSKKMLPETPRLVYRIFLFMFRICLAVGTVGYLCFLFTMLGLNMTFLISPDDAFNFSFLCLWYGFYFGVVVRDFSDLCATSIAVKGKFYKVEKDGKNSSSSKGQLPDRRLDKDTCALCANKMTSSALKLNTQNNNNLNLQHRINNFSNETRLQSINLEDFSDEAYGVLKEPDTSDEERTIGLSCGHEFHEYCIRGWVILGKQETCPYCNEKVDTRVLGNHPWEKYNRMYAQLLDWLRYLVAWQPVILIMINGVTKWMGLE